MDGWLRSVARQIRMVLGFLFVTVLASAAMIAVAPAHAGVASICTGFAGCNSAGRSNFGYQNVYTQSFWGMFGGHNCTNYVAYRHGGSRPAWLPPGMGDAWRWGGQARSAGIAVDSNPTVGSIAWWDSGAGLGPDGHVAYVQEVHADGVVVSEDAWGGDFRWRKYTPGSLYPSGFIHFADQPGAISDGQFVSYNGDIFRIAGGAPTYVTLAWWKTLNNPPVRTLSGAEWAALPQYPKDGAFVQGADNTIYVMAGGAPLAVSTWNVYGGGKPFTAIDAASIANAGAGGVWNHLRTYPANGTFLDAHSSASDGGSVYRVAGGAPIAVTTWDAFGGVQPYVRVDRAAIANAGGSGAWSHLRSKPSDMFIRGAKSGRVFRVVRDGHRYYVPSWTPYGGAQPTVALDDAAIDSCDHMDCTPFGAFDSASPVPGGVTLKGWAMDPEVTNSIGIHVYVDGKFHSGFTAGKSRSDVDDVFHRGDKYGFSETLKVAAGSRKVCAYGLDAGSTFRGNVELGCKTVSVPPPTFVGVAPSRLLDTRVGTGVSAAGAVGAGRWVDVQVTGRGGVPSAGVSAVVLNVTVTQPTSSGWVTVWPAGAARPAASNVNFVKGQTVANAVVVKVGAGGKVSLFNSGGSSHLVADVTGYYTQGSGFEAVTPVRLADSRAGSGGLSGLVSGTRTVQVAGKVGVPASGVTSVVLNVTATQPVGSGYVTVWPSGTARPTASNVNFMKGQTVASLVLAKLGSDGAVSVYSSSGTQLVVDVLGYHTQGSGYSPLVPARVLDTRNGTGAAQGLVPARSVRSVQVAGRGGVPASGASAVVASVTVTQPQAGGYVTAWPSGTVRPLASSLNFAAGQTVPNLVILPIGADGKISLYNGSNGTTHLITDIQGWY